MSEMKMEDTRAAQLTLGEGSYITGCFVSPREGGPNLFEFIGEKATIRLDRYAIIPLEEWEGREGGVETKLIETKPDRLLEIRNRMVTHPPDDLNDLIFIVDQVLEALIEGKGE